MNICVCIKQVPETSEVEIDPKTGSLIRDGIESKMNPYDLYALETALRLCEKYGGKTGVVTMGPPQAEEIIREAFMTGAEYGIILSDRRFAGSDVLATAYALAMGIKEVGQPDLIICGKQTTDGDTAQVGPEIAEFLGIPHITNVREIKEVSRDSMTIVSDMPDSLVTAKISLPCLISVEKDIHVPRLPSYRRKADSMKREITRLTLDNLADSDKNKYGLDGSPTQVIKIFPPEHNNTHEVWKDGDLPEQLFNYLEEKRLIG